jgi:putative alpha-1,2-mannosidase
LKEQVQDLHRDVTLQRGTSHASRAENALREGMLLEDQLERRHAEMERIRKHLESHWNENLRQIRMEQEVFQSQVCCLMIPFD